MKTSTGADSLRSQAAPRPVRFWAVEFFELSVAMVGGSPGKQRAGSLGARSAALKIPAAWLGLLVCCQLALQLYVSYEKHLADDQLHDIAPGSVEFPSLLEESKLEHIQAEQGVTVMLDGPIIKSMGALRSMAQPPTSNQVQVSAPSSQPMSVEEEAAAFHKELCADPARKDYAACAGLVPLTLKEEIMASLKEMCADARRKDRPECAGLVPMTLEEEISAFHKELCADPARKDYEACAGLVPMSIEEEAAAFHKELCSDPARKGYEACAGLVPMTLMEKIHSLQKELCADPKRRDYAECAGLAPLSVEEKIAAFHQELCSDPKRRDYVACAGLAAPTTLMEEIAASFRELCADPRRQGYAECAERGPARPASLS